MIKRRFYKLEHGDRDAPSESSSSSDSELDPVASEDSDDSEEEDLGSVQVRAKAKSDIISGYESEDSSAHEINLDSSGFSTSDEESGPQRDRRNPSGLGSTESFVDEPKVVTEQDDEDLLDLPDCVVKHKSVFKCMLCPKIVCLSKDTLNAHLKSKRHARSEKLLKEGRLKHMLDTDDRIEENKSDDEEDQETAPPVPLPENARTRRDKRRAEQGLPKSDKKQKRFNSKGGRSSMKSFGRKKRREDSD